MNAEKCDLCDGAGEQELRARCHLTAPLMATLDGGELVLSCYVPECKREVARFRVLPLPRDEIKEAR